MHSYINALPLPALLIGRDRRIVTANASAMELLGENFAGQNIVRAVRQPEALRIIDEAWATDQVIRSKIEQLQQIRKIYDISAARCEMPGGAGEAVLFTMLDTTAIVEAEQMRSDFVANVSHELRSPLATLSGIVETLQGPARNDEKMRIRFLDIMQAEALRMNRLIDDLLSLSKVQATEHIRPQGSNDITAMLKRLIAINKDKAEREAKTLVLSAPDDLPEVAGEADELTEVFQNLLDNAIKYGRPDTTINIDASVLDRLPGTGTPGIAVSFTDHGEGIEAEHIPRLTERFYRVDKGRSREKGGTGLGLAIVKHILNRHRGRLAIQSEPGKGSTFTVYLSR